MVVLDASVVIAWAYGEEGDRLDTLIRHVAANFATVPAHWILEITNTLLNSERRSRLKTGQRQEILASIELLPIQIDPETPIRGWKEIPALASRFGLTTYDAAYLELAMRLDTPLATLDQDLARAARKAGVTMFE
ncbi:MAG: type II toxin-antitoxin system VapC family toxin [Gammaproteobacteria bacterium]|nr:type II toxin-antitoxin system VapC family toxin [Gammaproteobacteria bacterium]